MFGATCMYVKAIFFLFIFPFQQNDPPVSDSYPVHPVEVSKTEVCYSFINIEIKAVYMQINMA